MLQLQRDKDGLQIHLGRASQQEKAALMDRILAALSDSDHLQFLIYLINPPKPLYFQGKSAF